ncbi:calcium-binding protein [Streptomyces sp. NPDC059578]|uniref:calcium-binding protein n=1 Tax=Streptomyces sp. NPDC059578 TaxID=3346874 RepID=UPI0036B61F83
MRTRAFVALTTGALALTAVAVPAAHADDRPTGSALPFSSASAAAAPGGPKISNVSVNGGKTVTAGVSKKTFNIKFTAKDPQGIDFGIAALWRGGPNADRAEKLLSLSEYTNLDNLCKRVDSTTSTCTIKVLADPKAPIPEGDLDNANAGRWNIAVYAEDKRGNATENQRYGTHYVKRAAKATAKATPNPIKKGKTLTVAGSLTRANWDTNKYAGFAGQSVKLQYKKKGTDTWTTVKTVSSNSRGKVEATAKATADGSYRFTYGGSTSTASVSSKADAVDVT